MLKEWDDNIAAFDPQADLKARVAAYENRMKSLQAKGQPIPAGSQPPSDLRPGPVADKNRPGCRYASVIQPLRGLAVAGAVFHQGFNNCFNGSAGARMYYQVFGKMIAAWRTNFDDPKLPFCIISLPTADEPQTARISSCRCMTRELTSARRNTTHSLTCAAPETGTSAS